MNLNHLMHPRNPYRVKRQFALLALEFPDFAPFVKHFDNGNATIDFKDPLALRALTQTLLKKDFDLDVELPADRLIPAVPQRLNYVLWIEDLLTSLHLSPDTMIRGIDVGTGASCIFPLLLCRQLSNCHITAFEVDQQSAAVAQQNVRSNGLSERITIVEVEEEGNSDWSHEVGVRDQSFHFLLCNPPFFPHEAQLITSHEFESNGSCHTLNDEIDDMSDESVDERRVKSPANCSTRIESVVPGGEVAFVQKIINSSFQLKNKIRIFSVMLGRKSSLMTLKRELRHFQSENDDLSFKSTELCQGKTMRWAIAWSFTAQLDKANVHKVKKPVKPLILAPIPYKKGMYYSIEGFTDRILDLITQDLQIRTFRLTRMSQFSSEILLKSLNNTWSNQRRKRRQQKRQENSPDGSLTESEPRDRPVEAENRHASHKRKRDEDEESADSCSNGEKSLTRAECCKRIKELAGKGEVRGEGDEVGISYLLNCCISLRKEGTGITLKVETREPCLTSESTYQLFQYLKNTLIQVPVSNKIQSQ